MRLPSQRRRPPWAARPCGVNRGAPSSRAGWRIAGGLLALACLFGCGAGEGESGGQRVDTYEVRGRVLGRTGRKLHVRHERIPGFRNAAGEPVGMGVMTMPFPVAETTAIPDGVEPGVKVRLRLRVRWADRPSYRVTALSVLAPDASLALEGPATRPTTRSRPAPGEPAGK